MQEKQLREYEGESVRIEMDMVCDSGHRHADCLVGTLSRDKVFGYVLKNEHEEIMLNPEYIKKITLVE